MSQTIEIEVFTLHVFQINFKYASLALSRGKMYHILLTKRLFIFRGHCKHTFEDTNFETRVLLMTVGISI